MLTDISCINLQTNWKKCRYFSLVGIRLTSFDNYMESEKDALKFGERSLFVFNNKK